ncbi:MAG: hypothetical protein J6W64_00900 [Bacilli bacterium]|nr:hypothetical protein [Bacilli bacterium]
MPGIILHNHFAKIVYSAISEEAKNAIDNINLYEFGANGSDVFLYKFFISKKQFMKNQDLYIKMHTKNTKAFLIELSREARLNKDLFSYLAGYVCHYYLDAITQPYAFYKTGIYDPSINNSVKYRGLQQKLQRGMDCYVLENYFNASPNTFKVYSKMLKLKKLPKTIMQDINVLYEKVYDVDNAYKLINECIRWQRGFYHFIYDPIGIKNKILSKVDNGKSIIDLNYLSLYNKSINIRNFDIFNFKHERWFNPADDTITSIDSYFDLMDKAKRIAIEAINALYKYIFLDEEINLDKYFADVSMFTGLPCNLQKEMKYFNNVFK